MIPGLISGEPTALGSGSTNPTSSTPSSPRRSNSSRASVTAAPFVPTISSRSAGPTQSERYSNATRQPTITRTISTDATTNTPRPMMRVGSQ